MQGLNLNAILAIATVYGEKLYDFDASESMGTLTASEYELDGDSVKINVGDGKFIFVALSRKTAEAGLDADKDIEIVKVTALRDASGEFEGQPWSVAKGDEKLFVIQ